MGMFTRVFQIAMGNDDGLRAIENNAGDLARVEQARGRGGVAFDVDVGRIGQVKFREPAEFKRRGAGGHQHMAVGQAGDNMGQQAMGSRRRAAVGRGGQPQQVLDLQLAGDAGDVDRDFGRAARNPGREFGNEFGQHQRVLSLRTTRDSLRETATISPRRPSMAS